MRSNTNEYNDFKEIIDDSREDLTGFIEKKFELAKLTVYEKTASLFSRIVYSMITVVFALILFFLVLITIGIFIGERLNNYAAGFGILILIVILIMVLVILNRKAVRKFLINMTLQSIKQIENDED